MFDNYKEYLWIFFIFAVWILLNWLINKDCIKGHNEMIYIYTQGGGFFSNVFICDERK